MNKFGIEGRVRQVAPNQDSTPVLNLLARQGYDLVIVGLPEYAAVAEVASAFPRTKFLIPDTLWRTLPGHPANVEGTDFRAGEAGS